MKVLGGNPRRRSNWVGVMGLVAVTFAVPGCHEAVVVRPGPIATVTTLSGRVEFAPVRRIAATMAQIANGATVSLIDPTSGNTLSSSVTDASGSFILSFSNLNPVTGAAYVLEAVKGLPVGGNSNRVGAPAARLRTLLFWNGGWQSLTNSAPGVGIVVSTATTALSTIVSLKKTAGTPVTLSNLVNTINGTTFTEAGTGLTNAADFQPMLTAVTSAIALDQDPLGANALNSSNGTYGLATGIPMVAAITPTIGTPGSTVSLTGSNFDPTVGRNTFWFGNVAASTWSVSTDRTTCTVTIPSNAYSAQLTLQQPNGVIQTIAAFYPLHGTVGTLVGNTYASLSDGAGALAQFNAPYGIAFDGARNRYVVDASNNAIRRVSPMGVVTTLAGNGSSGSSDGSGSTARFNSPQGIVFDNGNNLYVTDNGNGALRRVTLTGTVSTLLTGLAQPQGIVLDSNGNLFIAESNAHRITEYTIASGTSSVFAGNGVAAFADGTGTSAQFNRLAGLAVDTSNNIYVADEYNHRIRKVTPGAVVTTIGGNGTAAEVEGTGTSAQFAYPQGIAIDGPGNLYIAGYFADHLRKMTPSGVTSTIAGAGVDGYSDGATTSAQFHNCIGLSYDPSGMIVVGDQGNNVLRVVTP